MSWFDILPDELLHHILHYVPPDQILCTISRLSKRLGRVAETPLLWRFFCETTFRYWNPDHFFRENLREKAADVDWKGLFVLRLRRNQRVAALLDGIIASRVLRVQKTEEIARYGYDAKDYLLSQCRAPDHVDDVLARRYHATVVLDSIHRSVAVAEWAKFQKHAARPMLEKAPFGDRIRGGLRLERALGAFDLFMLHDQEGDMDEISEILDGLALRFREAHPEVNEMATRDRAVTLARWYRHNNMSGTEDEDRYRYLRNCLIGKALKDDRSPSLPLICAAIFSALAERIEVEAYCCALPGQVHSVVLSPPGTSLAGRPLPGKDEENAQQKMFIDIYGSGEEVSLDYLHTFLQRCGVYTGRDDILVPTPTDRVVTRTAQNIRHSFTSYRTRDRPVADLVPMIELNRGDWARNLQPALYSMIWASIMMVPILPDHDDVRWDWQQDVRDLLTYFYEYFPEDAWLVEKYICPMYDTFSSPGRRQNAWELPSKRVREQVREIRAMDAAANPPRRRSDLAGRPFDVRFRVGQVFKHRRYDYYGVILGWTVDGVAGSMGWDESSTWSTGTAVQPYYRCLVGADGADHHIIAQENIEVRTFKGGLEVLPQEIQDMLPLTGRFFRRWDGERGVFQSNLRELFPED